MSAQAVLPPPQENSGWHNGETSHFPAEPFLLRLDNIPATPGNRKRIREKVRELNRILEESGTPFRLRLL